MMLTVKDQTEDKVAALDLGADDYMVKPFSFAEFLARIRVLLRRNHNSISNKLEVGDLVIDLVKHRVTRENQVIDLSAKEFATLEYLARNKGKVLSRTSIIEHVWDKNFDSDTNLVDVYIRYLRKKIDEPYQRKLLHTIRGVGYKLDAPE